MHEVDRPLGSMGRTIAYLTAGACAPRVQFADVRMRQHSDLKQGRGHGDVTVAAIHVCEA